MSFPCACPFHSFVTSFMENICFSIKKNFNAVRAKILKFSYILLCGQCGSFLPHSNSVHIDREPQNKRNKIVLMKPKTKTFENHHQEKHYSRSPRTLIYRTETNWCKIDFQNCKIFVFIYFHCRRWSKLSIIVCWRCNAVSSKVSTQNHTQTDKACCKCGIFLFYSPSKNKEEKNINKKRIIMNENSDAHSIFM